MKKVCIFTVADERNMQYFDKFRNSLRKWHKEEDVDLLLVTEKEILALNDPKFFYRAKPIIANQLISDYEVVIGMDCDQVVCGDISQLWTDNTVDVMAPLNSNPIEAKNYPVQVWDITPPDYLNAGLVVMRSKMFVQHWLGLCMNPRFNQYRFGEQDLLNIMVYYGPYTTKVLDAGDNFWGLASKGYWNKIELRDNELFLPKGDEWPLSDKKIKVIHVAGGNTPNKMNFGPYMKPDVLAWVEKLMSN